MKKKSLILTTAFAMALGVGVAVGAHQSKAGVKEAEAVGEITLYCKMEQSWWKADGAAVGAHYWGGTGETQWPGERMTAVVGETDLWSITIPANNTGIIFTRVNGSGAIDDWGAKTKDQTIPTDGKNLFTITSSSPVWGDPGCEGTWSVYTPSEPEPEKDDPSTEKNVFYVWDKDKLLGDEPNNVKVYGFGQADNIKEMEWPGVHSNDYASISTFTLGETSVYKVELSVSYPQFILNDGEHQTDDITLGSHAGEVLLPSSTESNWQSASDFTNPPASNGYYILGNNTSSWTFTGATKLGEGDEDNYAVLTNFAVTKDNQYKIKSYFDKVTAWFNYHDGEEETSFNYVAPDSNPKNVYLSKDGTFYVTDYIPPVDPDVPEHNGYYVVGSKSEWKYAGATELTGGADEENYAKLLNYTVAKDEAFKVKKYEDGVETWFAINGDESEAGNYVAEAEKAVDIYASKDGKLYVFDHVEPVPAPKYYYSLNGAADVEMTPNGETEVMSASLSFKAGDELTFKVSESPYEVKTTYVAEPKEDVQYTNVELVENKLVFAQDYSGSLYLNIEGETGKLWAGHLEGYYLVGTHCGWNVKHGIKAPEKAGEAGTYVLAGVELAAEAEVKFYHFGDHVYEDSNQGYIAINPEKLHIADGISAELTEKDGNLKFNAGGCFDIYLNTNDGNYLSVENNGYTPVDLDDFLTKFDSDLSAVCNTLGSDDYLIKLKGEWSRQSSAFKLLSADDQKTIHDAGFDYEGEGKLGAMIAKYRYIVLKYGTDNCPDFIWGASHDGRIGNSMPELSTDSNVMLTVIITISAVSVASLGALLILKKKKRK